MGFKHRINKINYSVIVLLLLMVSPLQAQDQAVSGTVTDAGTGETLPGVNIVLKGTTTGTSTDAEGAYELTVPSLRDTLIFSFIGYQSQEVAINGRTEINVQMVLQAISGEEVVVVGYGTQKRRDLTGAVSSIAAEDIGNLPVTSVDEALELAAGVDVRQTNGAPGAGGTVRIRGTGSISAGNGPLYVIDGYPVSANPLSSINSDDIASIDILKDASATAIYGSRGANGVVLITTKRGRVGETSINFEARYGFQEVAKKIDLLDAETFAQAVITARKNSWADAGGDPSVPLDERTGNYLIPTALRNPSELGKGTDWQDEIFRTVPLQEYNLSASGGNETTRFYVSGGYLREKGVVLNSDFERFSLQVNLSSELSSDLRLKVSLSPSLSQTTGSNSNGLGGVSYQALISSPSLSVYNSDGSYNWRGMNFGNGFTPMQNAVALAKEIDNEQSDMRFLGSVSAGYDITDHLIFETRIGADIIAGRGSYFKPSVVGGPGRTVPPTNPVGTSNTSQSINWLNENTLTYGQTFGDAHDLRVLAGFTAQENNEETNFLTAMNFPNDLVPTLNAGEVTDGSSFRTEWALLSLLGRLNYSYKGRYLLTATLRRDGSSRFGENKRWGTFPSVAIGWRISDEPFMESVSAVSDLKVRGSYGLTGNFNIPNFASIGLLSSVEAILGPGLGTPTIGLVPSSLSNPTLTWETSRQFDVGIDLGLFSNRILLTADYYNDITSDLLLNVQIPASTGFTNTFQNIGKVRNWGFELSLNTRNLVGELQWSTSFDIVFNKNEVLALGSAGDPIFGSYFFYGNTHITKIGEPLGSYYGLEAIGIYETQEEVEGNPSYVDSDTRYSRPGDLRYRDVNGDGKITEAGDRTIIGDPYPDFIFGITNNLSFKNFNLSFQIDGMYGFQVLSLLDIRLNAPTAYVNMYQSVYDGRYISPDQPGDGETPKLGRIPTGLSNKRSSRWVQDASFMRLRRVALSYRVPQEVFGGSLQNLEVHLAATNLFTITDYRGYNPEVSNSEGDALAPGVTFGTYPLARSFTLGINLGF